MTEQTPAGAGSDAEAEDGLTGNEFDVAYIDKRDKGLNPGVTNKDVQTHQQVNPKDPGLPRAPEVVNKRPAAEQTAEEKAKLAEAENAEAAAKKAATDEAAAKEAEAKKTDEGKEPPKEETDYVKYDDPAADAAVEMLRTKGIAPQDAAKWFAPVLESGDVSKMDMAAMEKALGKTEAALVATSVKDYYTRQLQTIQGTAKAITEVLGGDANLARVRTWMAAIPATSENAKAVKEVLSMMNRGEYSAKLAAKELKALYEADAKNSSLSRSQISGDGVSQDAPKVLSRAEYLSEMKKAQAEGNRSRISELRNNRARAHN